MADEVLTKALARRYGGVPLWAPLLVIGFGLVYLVPLALTTGLRGEQFIPLAMMAVAAVTSDRSRRFLVACLPIPLYGVFYDWTHITEPLVRRLHVHVAEPFLFELRHFGVVTAAGRLTLSQFFALHHWAALDLVTGTAYLAFLYVCVLFGLWLVWTATAPDATPESKTLARGFAWAFFAMNVVGFATYYIWPSAPPWYVAQYGLGPANFEAPASAAAALRWDQLTGLHYFAGFYGKSADVFGAIPSLHCAQPALVFLYARLLHRPALSAALFAYLLLVCFSAIYLQHHYLLDVLIGIAYALTAFAIERVVHHLSRSSPRWSQPAVGAALASAE